MVSDDRRRIDLGGPRADLAGHWSFEAKGRRYGTGRLGGIYETCGFGIAIRGHRLRETSTGPDCAPVAFQLTGNGSTAVVAGGTGDNRNTQCETWTVAYEATGLTGYTVAFQSSVGSNTPTSFGSYTGNTVNSSASFGTAALGLATYCNLGSCSMGGTTVNTPWIRVTVSGASGTGLIRGVFYGYRTGATGGTGGGGGGGGGGSGCPNPCPVEGVDAAGAAPTVPSVGAAGFDGTDVRRIKTDTAGDIINSPLPRGASLSGQQSVTGTAVNLGAHTVGGGFCVVADIGNTITIYVGPTGTTTSTGFPLVAGQAACNNLGNTNELFVVASTTGATIESFGTDLSLIIFGVVMLAFGFAAFSGAQSNSAAPAPLQFQNATTPIGTAPILNCSTGMTCTKSGNVINATASGSGGSVTSVTCGTGLTGGTITTTGTCAIDANSQITIDRGRVRRRRLGSHQRHGVNCLLHRSFRLHDLSLECHGGRGNDHVRHLEDRDRDGDSDRSQHDHGISAACNRDRDGATFHHANRVDHQRFSE